MNPCSYEVVERMIADQRKFLDEINEINAKLAAIAKYLAAEKTKLAAAARNKE